MFQLGINFLFPAQYLFDIFLIYIFHISTEKLYDNKDLIEERHRHRYEINPDYIQDLEAAGLKFVGKLYIAFFTQ